MSAKILIVDDEQDILQIFSSALIEEGYEVSCASNGEDALEIFGAKSFDLVITDMKMPGMDGLELLKRIKELDESSEVIILTGFATLDNAIEALKEDGAFDYLTKPLEGLDILYLTINKALERRRLRSENELLLEQLKQAKEELIRKVQEQQLLLDSVETMIWYLTDAETYGAVNEAAARFVGMAKADLTGTRLAEILNPQQAEIHLAGNREVFNKKRKIRSDVWLEDDRGEPHLLTITKTPKLNDRGGVDYVVCSAHDITERKQMEEALRQSEARYRAIVEDQTELICRFLPDGTLTFVNGAFCRYFGKTQDELIGRSFMPLILEKDRKIVEQHLALLGTARTITTYEHRAINGYGEIRWQEWSSRALFHQQNDVVEFQSVGRDTTERKQMQQELYRVQKLESLGILAGGIAHDFNNILGMILGYISLAALDIPSGNEARESLVEAEKAVLQAREIAKQLLTFSEGGDPTKRLIWLSPHLKEVVRFTLSGSNIKSEFYIDDDLWPVECDLTQINQVVSNLTMNAREAMPEGGTVEIYAQNVNLPASEAKPADLRKYVRISIKDQGAGISEDSLGKIFDPFFSTKQRGSQKGMGLGLALVYSIVNKHKGRITVDSHVGIGTTFDVYLPVSQEKISTNPRVEKLLSVPAGTGRVLLMEDDDTLRTAVMTMLLRMGYEATGCSDGIEAVELYTTAKQSGDPFDVVILDLTVQGGIGAGETIEKLRIIDPGVRAIVSSGYSNDPVISDYRIYGFSGVLAKPCTIGELNEILQRIMPSKTSEA